MTRLVRPEEGALFDLSTRSKLRLSGADRLRYLNGQVTNDVRKANDSVAIHACVLNAKGKVNADVFITVDGESLLLDAEPGTADALTARLERYIIADDVQVEDVSAQFALFHVIGAEISPPKDAQVRNATRFGLAGIEVWIDRARHDATLQELSTRLPLCDEACTETFRIEKGVPRWGRELTDEIIPIEANLEAETVDYAKGCYIGQEVISRIKMSGQTNKRLCGLAVVEGSVREGMRLSPAGDSKDVGWITSVTTSVRLGKEIALGFLKRGYQDIGTELLATADSAPAARVRVAPLPFA